MDYSKKIQNKTIVTITNNTEFMHPMTGFDRRYNENKSYRLISIQ